MNKNNDLEIKDNWNVIIPENSKYKIVAESTDSLSLAPQTFLFEYGPNGHAKSLCLGNTSVNLEIQFTCHISNLYKAMYSAGQYAFNVLKPQFLIHSREILEQYSITKLRGQRKEIADQIREMLKEKFDEFGFDLESVIIGAVEKVPKARQMHR